MRHVRLREVARIDRRVVDPTTLDADTAYLGLEHIEKGGAILGMSSVGGSGVKSTKFEFGPQHVLFGKLRPNLGKISRPLVSGVCSTDITPILPGPDLDENNLTYSLRQPSTVAHAANLASGANLPRLSPEVLLDFLVPVPTLAEQQRIAGILDKADAIRTKRRASLVLFEELLASLFRVLSTSESSTTASLGDVAEFYAGNSLPSGEVFHGQKNGVMLAKVSDMNLPGNESILRATALWTSEATPRASTVSIGAVVFPKRGASIATNKKRLAVRPTCLDPNLMGVQPDESVLNRHYLFYWFREFDLSAIASGSSVPQLNKRDLARLKISIPSMAVQQEFAARVEKINAQRALVERALEKDEELFASLQARAFAGEL